MKGIMVRVSPVIVEKMKTLVDAGKYASPSDLSRMAIQWYLNQEEFQENLKGAVERLAAEGKLDEVLEGRLRQIWQRIAIEQPGPQGKGKSSKK
jgi:Arc/MetJ-type ribon-helix-helix transcriptional regulator